jgi:thiamine transport system ATP-binding protein
LSTTGSASVAGGSDAAGLELDGVSVRFGDGEGARAVLGDVDLSVPAGTTVSLLGPSGSGKTTLLRVVAGLQPLTSGTVRLDGRDLAPVPVHERGVGLMFQDFALFPHRDVGDNVAFGLRMSGQPEPQVRQRVAEVLELVGLPGIERRRISTLSGGEQQRVALARALAPRPRILLLDEPMGSLDRALRERLPLELRALFDQLGLTVVYVTHDQDEALAVSDRTVVLHDGVVEADAASEELWARPPNAFVARFLGYRNVVPARASGDRLETPWGTLPLAAGDFVGLQGGAPVTVLLRPEGVSIRAARTGASTDASTSDPPSRVPYASIELPGVVTARRFRGDHFVVVVDVRGAPLEVELRAPPIPRPTDHVFVLVEPSSIAVLPAEPAILSE